jgi:hypothetical protein
VDGMLLMSAGGSTPPSGPNLNHTGMKIISVICVCAYVAVLFTIRNLDLWFWISSVCFIAALVPVLARLDRKERGKPGSSYEDFVEFLEKEDKV